MINDEMLCILDRIVTSPIEETMVCGHIYGRKSLMAGVPTIHLWGHRSTIQFVPRIVDVETAWEIIIDSDIPDVTIQPHPGTLADWRLTIEREE